MKKGWSADEKYKVTTNSGKKLLLRISNIKEKERKHKEFQHLSNMDPKIRASTPLAFGSCLKEELTYIIYTWIDGEDADIALNNYSKEKRYKMGYTAGQSLCKINSIPVLDEYEPWDKRYNKKIDNKLKMYESCGANKFL
ncbi:phosphotransferase [Proteinivorax tanatarense]|uniref:Phosphotransferase n=1 Tax=Proteinivorax tanatarense TaxID=1260629 RepID=A0AAU7VQF9_9FIRM